MESFDFHRWKVKMKELDGIRLNEDIVSLDGQYFMVNYGSIINSNCTGFAPARVSFLR